MTTDVNNASRFASVASFRWCQILSDFEIYRNTTWLKASMLLCSRSFLSSLTRPSLRLTLHSYCTTYQQSPSASISFNMSRPVITGHISPGVKDLDDVEVLDSEPEREEIRRKHKEERKEKRREASHKKLVASASSIATQRACLSPPPPVSIPTPPEQSNDDVIEISGEFLFANIFVLTYQYHFQTTTKGPRRFKPARLALPLNSLTQAKRLQRNQASLTSVVFILTYLIFSDASADAALQTMHVIHQRLCLSRYKQRNRKMTVGSRLLSTLLHHMRQ